ncbi:DUF308 domain-containing protein [uncultured Treponema sp.]|uniref:DUF308 domain-containing protein n=1 Tax=uncultured Treponema sp. TaxID=162155 RepID=UPI0025874AA0|nr:DUF308 domain-containing protein [uncultured Treponema sp.]
MNPRIFLGILSAVVGLLAVINPQSSIEAIVILIGIGAIVNGINSILKVKRFSFSLYFERTVIIRSVAGILVGILAVILPFAFFNMIQKIVRIILYIQAVFLLLSAISEFILVSGTENSAPFLTEAVCSIFIAVLLFMLPADFGVRLVRAAGVLILISGIIFAFREWKSSPTEVEAEIIE